MIQLITCRVCGEKFLPAQWKEHKCKIMNPIEVIYTKLSTTLPGLASLFILYPHFIYQYIITGEYGFINNMLEDVDWDQNFCFLWLILIIEGYEK